MSINHLARIHVENIRGNERAFVNSSLNERTHLSRAFVGLDPRIRTKEIRAKIYSSVSMIKETRRAFLPHPQRGTIAVSFPVVLRLLDALRAIMLDCLHLSGNGGTRQIKSVSNG